MVAWTQSKEVSKIFDKFWQTCFWNLPTQNLEAWSLDTNMSHVSHNWLWKRFSTPCQTQSMFNNRVGDLSHKICLGTCLIKKWGHQLMTKRVPNLLTRGCLFRTEMGHSSHTRSSALKMRPNNMEHPLFNNQICDLSHNMCLGTWLNKTGSKNSNQQSMQSIWRRFFFKSTCQKIGRLFVIEMGV